MPGTILPTETERRTRETRAALTAALKRMHDAERLAATYAASADAGGVWYEGAPIYASDVYTLATRDPETITAAPGSLAASAITAARATIRNRSALAAALRELEAIS